MIKNDCHFFSLRERERERELQFTAGNVYFRVNFTDVI